MLLVLLAATDLGGLLLGAWLLFSRPGRRTSWAGAAARLTALGLGLGIATGAVGLGVGQPFLVLRLWCHVLFCVLAPLGIALGLARRGTFGLTLVALGLAAEGAYLWARHVEPYRLEVRRHVLRSERLSPRTAPLRIVVLADLQTDAIGAFE